jgi:hypothetical protein
MEEAVFTRWAVPLKQLLAPKLFYTRDASKSDCITV